jgi:hypothetical protein
MGGTQESCGNEKVRLIVKAAIVERSWQCAGVLRRTCGDRRSTHQTLYPLQPVAAFNLGRHLSMEPPVHRKSAIGKNAGRCFDRRDFVG